MKVLAFLPLVVLLVLPLSDGESRSFDASDPPTDPIARLTESVASLKKSVKNTIGTLARQMMLQQLFVEERIRSDGASGVKQIRQSHTGTRNYYSQTHTSKVSVLAIHDHSNNDRTVGMGEFIGVLNGVEFRTRHNDYRLYMPHRTSKQLHATENVPFPDVPPEVTSKSNVSEQVKEMREWFKAWKNQDYSVRDYRKYFRPVICYLEGAWTAAGDKIDEPFESDRHFIDASSWFDLQEKIRFTSYTGRKDDLENFSFLPTTIMNVTEDGIPQFAQWNYRILCHPVSRDLPLNRLRVVDELGSQLAAKRTYREHSNTRSARFQLNPFDTDKWTEREDRRRFGLLDEIMGEVPGKDNYQGNLTDTAFGLSAFSLAPGQRESRLRADRYHRWFRVARNDAMGVSTRHRGYSDENLFMAMTTQPKVQGLNLQRCQKMKGGKKCSGLHQKWSYAIPLEIIFLTPLSKWNPYDIEFKGSYRSKLGKTVEAGGRNGGHTLKKAYNGTNSKRYYQTPVEFFSGNEVGSGAADTTRNSVGVLDKKGNVRVCKASGTRIFFPPIAGVGFLRQRYPIMPVHGEGSASWKELDALKDLVLSSKTNGYVFKEPLQSGPIPTEPPRKDTKLQVQLATAANPGPHTHNLFVTADQVDFIKAGGILHGVKTSTAAGHDHTMSLRWSPSGKYFYIYKCDSKDTRYRRCWDRHFVSLIVMPDQ
ncbi:uncharacterized protein LOC116306318 [Actinia tenebrosa]|uniref:Uncharacterized protein LOC116306318 n=1 Tax=Actinia tenebrosa TaxID=6105 RepID=A0A6P8IYG6_ACTTE|nr:uncharacterized protein LOC116306318 [Actinia tenebrosa]XP_031572212.1 uncharacterized protein LOC116306318 [Actinia tenebrosa]